MRSYTEYWLSHEKTEKIYISPMKTVKAPKTEVYENRMEGLVKSESSQRRLKIPDGLLPQLLKTRQYQEQEKEARYINNKDEDYVLCYRNGEPFRPNYLSHLFGKLLEKNKLERIRFHDLRHTHGSIAIMNAPLYDVSKSLGHSRQEVTQRIYLKDIVKVKSAAVDSVDKTLKTAYEKELEERIIVSEYR